MPVIVDNPRYERLAQCLAAGMRQQDISKELDFTEPYITALKNTETIRTRISELLSDRASRLSQTDAIATIEERKRYLSDILKEKHDMPLSAGHRVAAAKELNLMERVYQDGSQGKPGVVNITYVFNQVQSAQSTQCLPETPKIIEIEGKTT